MKYYLRNFYSGSLQIRDTQIRLIRYIRRWNLKNPDRQILRREIQEIGRVDFKPVKFLDRVKVPFYNIYLKLEKLKKAIKFVLRIKCKKDSKNESSQNFVQIDSGSTFTKNKT